MKGVVIAMLVLAKVQLMVEPSQAIIYGQVNASLAPCVPYLTRGGNPASACCNGWMHLWLRVPYLTGGGNPAPACCDGVKIIKGMASNMADKQAACNCVKQAAIRYSNLKDDAAQALPTKCGVSMDIPVSRSTNCDL
ncbi:hypothetical protein NMG60_11023134 [Bertholletia excelsa]